MGRAVTRFGCGGTKSFLFLSAMSEYWNELDDAQCEYISFSEKKHEASGVGIAR